jgi:TonB family protein
VGQPHYGPPPGAGKAGLNAIWLGLIGLALVVVLAAGGILIYLKNRDAAIRGNNDAIDEPAGNDPSLVAPDEDSATPPPTPSSRTKGNSRAPISGGVLNGKAISLPKPVYPAIARAARASGTVIVQVTIDESGKVTEARAVSGHPLLQASAVQAARQARFSPTQLAGKPVRITGTISYNFTPE